MEQNECRPPRSGAIDAGGQLRRKRMGGSKRRAKWIEGLCSKLTLSARFLNPRACSESAAAPDRYPHCAKLNESFSRSAKAFAFFRKPRGVRGRYANGMRSIRTSQEKGIGPTSNTSRATWIPTSSQRIHC